MRLWGVNLHRPGDIVYQVAGATVTDDRILRVHLYLDLDGTAPLLELEGPVGVKIDGGNLTVQGATAVRWNGAARAAVGVSKGPAVFLGD